MPSVANIIGTDLSNYKVVSKNQFACNLMHVGRDAKIPVALNQGEDIIVSPAYFVFEVDNTGIIPEYLQLVFTRSEFDRNAWFHTDSDVRGGMDKDGLRDLLIPIPELAEQQRIVDQYNAIQTRIENNKQTIAKLEETAQAIYRKMFVDDIDPENLPDGWNVEIISSIIESTLGGDWGKELPEGNYTEKVSCIRGADINAMKVCDTTNAPIRYILKKNLESRQLLENNIVIEMSGGTPTQSTGRCSIAMSPIIFSCENPMICSNFCKVIRAKKGFELLLFVALEHFYSLGTFFKYENSSNGIQNLDLESFCNEENIIVPDEQTLSTFNFQIKKLIEHKLNIGKELTILRDALSQILTHL